MKKRAIFIDRDGTIINEPADEQIDSLEKLEFVPGVIGALRQLRGLDTEIVLATNQDGLGTDSFPEETFHPAHEKMLGVLRGEGWNSTTSLSTALSKAITRPRENHAQECSGNILAAIMI